MNTSVRIKLLSLCIIGCLTLPSTMAFAGDPEEAAKYYQKASKAYEEGEYAEAADLLERAFAYDPDLIYKYNEVLALQAMGKYDKALKILDVYEGPMLKDPQDRFTDIKQIHAQIEQAKAKAAANADDEGNPADDKSHDQLADEGVGADANGDTTGDTNGDVNAAVTPPPAEDGPNILGWSLVGVGAAGLGAAGLFGSRILISDVVDRGDCMAAHDNHISPCYDDFDNPDAQYEQDRDTYSTHRTLTWVSLGVGVVALVGGGVVLYMDQNAESQPDMGDAPADTEVTLTPYVDGDGAGGVLHVSF